MAGRTLTFVRSDVPAQCPGTAVAGHGDASPRGAATASVEAVHVPQVFRVHEPVDLVQEHVEQLPAVGQFVIAPLDGQGDPSADGPETAPVGRALGGLVRFEAKAAMVGGLHDGDGR